MATERCSWNGSDRNKVERTSIGKMVRVNLTITIMLLPLLVIGVLTAPTTALSQDNPADGKGSAQPNDYIIHPASTQPYAQPTWLDSPSKHAGTDVKAGALHLFADGSGKGMKWSMQLPRRLDLSTYSYAVIRYKAHNIATGDYFVLLAGQKDNEKKTVYLCIKWLSGLRADGQWHTSIVRIAKSFTATSMMFQLRSSGKHAEACIDYIRFTVGRPLLDARDMLSTAEGWSDSTLSAGTFLPVDLLAESQPVLSHHLADFAVRSWFQPGNITVEKIPFTIADGKASALITPQNGTGTVSCSVGAAATEAYMLLGAQPSHISTTAFRRPLHEFDNPERFVVEVTYEDDITDEIFPVDVLTGRHEIHRRFGIYCLTNLRPQIIQKISLKNKMTDGYFILSALTLNQSRSRIHHEETVLCLPPAAKENVRDAGAGIITAIPEGYAIGNNLIRMKVQVRDGLTVTAIESHCLDGATLHIAPGPLFEIGCQRANLSPAGPNNRREQVVYGPQKRAPPNGTKDILLSSEQVPIGTPRLVSAAGTKTLVIPLDGTSKGVFLKGDISFTVGNGPDILMNLNLVQVADKTFVPIVSFPLVHNIAIGSAEETWYLWGVRGGIIHHDDHAHHRNLTGHYALQVTDAFNPKANGGLALFTYDTKGIKRAWDMRRDNRNGISWRLDYLCQEYKPGEKIEIAPTAIRAHTGDWRVAFKAYRHWLNSWYKPEVPRKPWFQKIFYYQQTTALQHLLDKTSGQWNVKTLVEKYRDFFGCLDYIHIYDFAKIPGQGRGMGDYDAYAIGGLDAMRSGIKAFQHMGIPVGLYMEGYLCDQKCGWGKENVLAYCVRRMNGEPKLWHNQKELPGETYMCAASEVWRQRLVELCKKTVRNLGPNGIYLDEYGHLGSNNCWSRQHGHRVPSSTVRGEQDTLRAVRDAIPDDIVLLTEEAPNDINTQFQDGSLTYAIRNTSKRESPSRINFLRFAIPSFKQFHIVQYTKYNDGAWELLKFPFFNGQGYWLHGGTVSWYSDDAHGFLKTAFRILHQREDCFTSSNVDPLVPTLNPVIYANRFSSDRCTVWTLFNADYRTFRGECLSLPYNSGKIYRDAFREEAIVPRIENGRAILPIVLGPRAVGCIVEKEK